jgi:hypothetical protein
MSRSRSAEVQANQYHGISEQMLRYGYFDEESDDGLSTDFTLAPH